MTTGQVSDPDVSVVVIAYNDAGRLPRAVRSVQRQTLRNLEIIIVDDASTDETAAVAERLAKTDARIRYERLPVNSGGCSAPRNRGIDLARAPWVMFCDSDDEYERHACKNLLLAAERLDADVVCGTAERIDVNTGRTKRWRSYVHETETVAAGLAEFPELLYDTISVNKIYRKSVLLDNDIRFPEGLLFEDQLFTIEAMAASRRVAAIPERVYWWHVDKVSDEPSITQRRHEANNADNRIEINRRIDAFLDDRGLAAIKRIKDLKFLRHDLYLYLSSILEVDDETAQMLIDRLTPYVTASDLSRAWELRPALRVAIYHLLVNDLEGIRSAMRFIKWGSVVDAPIESSGVGEHWACEHLASGPTVGGFPARDWLDVSDLHIKLFPFSQRRYLHQLSRLAVEDGLVVAEGTTTNFDGSLGLVDSVELAFVLGAERLLATVPVQWVARDGLTWAWSASGKFVSRLGRPLSARDQGTIALRMTEGSAVNLSNCRTTELNLPKLDVPYWGRTEPLGPDTVRVVSASNGAVGWRSARVSPKRARLARWRSRWFSVPGAKRLAVIGGLIRRDVYLTTLQRLGALLPPKNLAVFESEGGRAVAGNARAVSDALRRMAPEVRQAWVTRGRPELTPDFAEPVEVLSTRHLWLMSRARWWIDDGTSPLSIRKPAHTTSVLLSDGVPVHRIGLDDPTTMVGKALARDVRKRGARADILVTASPYASVRLRPALAFSAETVEAGLPRLDLPSHTWATDLPVERAVVVYAPAWRKRESEPTEPLIDLEEWVELLGERTFLLLKAPQQQRFSVPGRLRFAVRTVPDDIELSELLGVADLFISDYSSWIRDAAVRDLPIVLFQPDRETYVSRTRGLYPSVADAGPLTRTTPELVDEVRVFLDDRNGWETANAAGRRAIAANECLPDDGKASERAVASILASRSSGPR